MPAFLDIRVGSPIEHETLAVFPLFSEAAGGVDYLLSEEALAGGGIKVEEVGEAGSVPNLLVDNQADCRVLFVEGEELRGAKQNRVLNTSVLAAARCKTVIPVSCVERGRWRHNSPHFASGGSSASHQLRHVLRKSVTRSAREGLGHSSDQHEVWKEVDRQMSALGSHSPTQAMSDTYETHRQRLADFQDRLKYVEGATGLAVAVRGKVVSIDLFDKPATCRKVWDRLLTGLVMDALEPGQAADRPSDAAVQEMLATLRSAPWQQCPAVGAGEEFRAELDGDRHATALCCDGAVIHGSLVVTGG